MLERTPVLVAAAGATWETEALDLLARDGGAVLHKRCVDLPDLLASAGTGQAGAAVVAAGLPGLDADSVERLGRSGVGVVIVATAGELAADAARLGRLGAARVLSADELASLPDVVHALGTPAGEPLLPPGPEGLAVGDALPSGVTGRLTAVWGPAGAPGRTTTAVALAAELAARDRDVLLVDADPYAGSVAQHLGVLDAVSGLLAAARLGNTGRLDPESLAGLARQAAPGLRVLTGLPRADRWVEVRAAAWEEVLDAATGLAEQVVVDVGFSLEDDSDGGFGGPQRNGLTLGTLERADEVLVVGSADPVGLARLARGLVEVHDLLPATPLRVVVNRMRPSLGWSEAEVRGMVEGFVRPLGVHFLPEDRAAADRALMAGRSLAESGESGLRSAVAALVDAALGERTEAVRPPRRGVRRRRGRNGHAPKSR